MHLKNDADGSSRGGARGHQRRGAARRARPGRTAARAGGVVLEIAVLYVGSTAPDGPTAMIPFFLGAMVIEETTC